MTCACCPLLCEMLPHREPEVDRPTVEFATERTEVRGHARKEIRHELRRFRGSDPRSRKGWLPAARIAPAFDRRVFALLAIAVVPGFWVWPLRGHIKMVTVSVFAVLRGNKRLPELQGYGWKQQK